MVNLFTFSIWLFWITFRFTITVHLLCSHNLRVIQKMGESAFLSTTHQRAERPVLDSQAGFESPDSQSAFHSWSREVVGNPCITSYSFLVSFTFVRYLGPKRVFHYCFWGLPLKLLMLDQKLLHGHFCRSQVHRYRHPHQSCHCRQGHDTSRLRSTSHRISN